MNKQPKKETNMDLSQDLSESFIPKIAKDEIDEEMDFSIGKQSMRSKNAEDYSYAGTSYTRDDVESENSETP